MTRGSPGGAPFLRILLAAVVAADLISFYIFLGEARAALAAGAPLNEWSEILSRPVVRGAVVLAGLAAVTSFARRPGRLWEGLVALAALTLLSTTHTQLFGSPWRHLFFSGLCLAGWLLGLGVRRFEGAPTDESYARMGSIALLAAAYFSSGISKIVFGGWAWTSGLPVQSAILGQSGLVGSGIVGAYRFRVVTTPGLAGILSTASVGFEIAAPLLLAGRRTRMFVALGLAAMHANIYLLTAHILYWESMVLLVVFGLSSEPTPAAAESAAGGVLLASSRAFVAGVVLLSVCAVLAIGHQVRRHALPLAADVEKAAAAAHATPTTMISSVQRIGPFTLGQTLAGSWLVDALELRDEGFMVRVQGKLGSVRFDLTCASQGVGRFDVGAAHIYYSRDMDFGQMEEAGRAVQAEVRTAAEGRDVCEQLQAWRLAARAGAPG